MEESKQSRRRKPPGKFRFDSGYKKLQYLERTPEGALVKTSRHEGMKLKQPDSAPPLPPGGRVSTAGSGKPKPFHHQNIQIHGGEQDFKDKKGKFTTKNKNFLYI